MKVVAVVQPRNKADTSAKDEFDAAREARSASFISVRVHRRINTSESCTTVNITESISLINIKRRETGARDSCDNRAACVNDDESAFFSTRSSAGANASSQTYSHISFGFTLYSHRSTLPAFRRTESINKERVDAALGIAIAPRVRARSASNCRAVLIAVFFAACCDTIALWLER